MINIIENETTSKINPKQVSTIKIKFVQEKKPDLILSTLAKTQITENSLSILNNETNNSTIVQDDKKMNKKKISITNSIINTDDLSSLIFGDSSTKCSCMGDVSFLKDNLMDKNSNNPINYLPEVKYNPVPEREYYSEILEELLKEEETNLHFKNCSYINYQEELDNKKRANMINFIYQMAKVFKFKTGTIFLTVQTMNRFLCKEKIDPMYYDLLCICCLVIAGKFNEIFYPAYKDIVFLFGKDKFYTVEQALKMEVLILKTINYNLFPIYPKYFFDIISQKANLTDTEYYLGSLMLELAQFDFYLYPVKNSFLAQIVFCKVLKLTSDNIKPFNVLKNILPEKSILLNEESSDIYKKTSNVIDELLHNLNSEYFVDIYQKYIQPNVLGKDIDYFLYM